MNSEYYLHQTCFFGYRRYRIYCKTGKFVGNYTNIWGDAYEFLSDNGKRFTITIEMNLTDFVGLELNDSVTFAHLDEDILSIFFVLNHRNLKSKYYPDSILSQYWKEKSKGDLIGNLILYIQLLIASRAFNLSFSYTRIRREILEIWGLYPEYLKMRKDKNLELPN